MARVVIFVNIFCSVSGAASPSFCQGAFSGPRVEISEDRRIRPGSVEKPIVGVVEKEDGIWTYLNRRGMLVAELEYRFDARTRTLFIDNIRVQERYRGQGVSIYLMSELLKAFPQTNRVGAQLVDDNFDALEAMLENSASVAQAIQSTPFYRALSYFGFERIRSHSLYPDDLVLVLERNTVR